jgi:stage V sporulation protein R
MPPVSWSTTPELAELQEEIQGYASGYGLDFFTTIFEVIDYRQICEIAAYGGFPVRYPHWRFGMEYDRLIKSYSYGLSKIYELVINTDPCYAYLLDGNRWVDQKLVMAHVYGHCDFFKNNSYFSQTNRKMIDGMANHAVRLRRHMDRVGVNRVEEFIDVCASLDNLIDPWCKYRESLPGPEAAAAAADGADDSEENLAKLKSGKNYLESYINPPEFLESQRKKTEDEAARMKRIPPHPERDILAFLLAHAPLEQWEVDVLSIIREEAYYFLPQMQTKIMNEGWATYWHSKIMTAKALKDDEIVDYADVASGVTSMGPTQLNPYKIGVELFRDIEDRWNKGQFGPEWENCARLDEKESWDKQLGLGRDRIFEVRKLYNDVNFIDEFFTEDFCRRQKFFMFAKNRRSGDLQIASREFAEIKQKMLHQLTNAGQPFIFAVDANYMNRGELLLAHRHEGVDLKLNYARETLKNVEKVWRRPVSILTVIDDKPKRIRFDGREIGMSDETAAADYVL